MTLQTELQELITVLGTDWKNDQAKMGVIANLQTSATNLVAAINEVLSIANAAVSGTAPDATTSVKGIVELATDSEALAMAATDVVLRPSNVGAVTNVANGLAKLDASGKIASAQLPSFVDDVVEAANFAALPGIGETGKIYVTLDNNKTYRWGGSVYSEISASPGSTDAVPEGTTNLYFTNVRADARADSRITAQIGNPDADLTAVYVAAKA